MSELKRIRKQRKLSAAAIAVKAKVSPTTITLIEKYDYTPGEEVQARIASALGLDVAEIFPPEEVVASA